MPGLYLHFVHEDAVAQAGKGLTHRCTAGRRGSQDQNRISEPGACACCYTASVSLSQQENLDRGGSGPHSPGTVCWEALWAMLVGLPMNPEAYGVNG